MAQEKTIIIKDENVNPVDSLKVLHEKMLDPRAYGSCALTVPGKCLGCRAFETCEEATKGEGQPMYYGTRLIKSREQGGGVRESITPCFVYWQRKEQIEAGGAIWRIIAREGGTIVEKQSEPINTVPNPRDPEHPLPAPGTLYRDVIVETTVPEWQGIDKNLRLLNAAYASAVMQREQEDRRERREQEQLREAAPMGVPADATKAFLPTRPERRPVKKTTAVVKPEGESNAGDVAPNQ